jgi:hypothetical protein
MGAHMDETLLQLRTDKGGDMSNDNALLVARAELRRLQDDEFNLAASCEPVPSEVSANVNERKHSHYFKPVAHLTEIDVYRICEMYVDDRSGATQHAIKKLLLPGERGAGKSREQDIKEAVDTLNRKLQMMKEDEARA